MTERQKIWLSIATIPLLPVVAAVFIASLPIFLAYYAARDLVDDACDWWEGRA